MALGGNLFPEDLKFTGNPAQMGSDAGKARIARMRGTYSPETDEDGYRYTPRDLELLAAIAAKNPGKVGSFNWLPSPAPAPTPPASGGGGAGTGGSNAAGCVNGICPMPGLPTAYQAPATIAPPPDWAQQLPGMSGTLPPLYQFAQQAPGGVNNANLGLHAYQGMVPDLRGLLAQALQRGG